MEHPTFAAEHARYKGMFETPLIKAPIANSRVLNEKLKTVIEQRMREGAAGSRTLACYSGVVRPLKILAYKC